jgi:hypothetical protein
LSFSTGEDERAAALSRAFTKSSKPVAAISANKSLTLAK